MIDLFLLLILAAGFWLIVLGILKIISRLFSLKPAERKIQIFGFNSGRLHFRSGTPYFLLILGVYNLFLAKEKIVFSSDWSWSGIAVICFNLLILLSLILLNRALRSEDQ